MHKLDCPRRVRLSNEPVVKSPVSSFGDHENWFARLPPGERDRPRFGVGGNDTV